MSACVVTCKVFILFFSLFSLGGAGEGFLEELAFELNLRESSKSNREKASPSLAEPSRGHRAHRVFGGMAVPCVQSKADRTAEAVRGQSGRTSVLVRTL